MARVSRSSLVRNVARFEEGAVSGFLIDNIKLSFSPRAPRLRAQIARGAPLLEPSSIRDTTAVGLSYAAPTSVVHRGNEHVLTWETSAGNHQQGLGAFRRGRTATLTVDTNPIRAVRRALSRPEQRRHDAERDNYLDPRVLEPPQAQARCFDALKEIVRSARGDYIRIVSGLFGADLAESDVLVSVNLIEIAWDALAPFHASLVPAFLARVWKRRLDAGRRDYHPKELARNKFSDGGDGVLKAEDGRGLVMKLYGKTADVARFEVQLTGDRAKGLTGRRLAPDDWDAFVESLRDIATQVYPHILAVQEEAAAPPIVSVHEVFPLLGRDPIDRYIVGELLAGNRVKRRGQSDYRRLVALRSRGVVMRGPGKGWWSATHKFAEVAEVLRIAQSINERRAS